MKSLGQPDDPNNLYWRLLPDSRPFPDFWPTNSPLFAQGAMDLGSHRDRNCVAQLATR